MFQNAKNPDFFYYLVSLESKFLKRHLIVVATGKVFISSHGNNLKTSSKSASLFCRKIGLYPAAVVVVVPTA